MSQNSSNFFSSFHRSDSSKVDLNPRILKIGREMMQEIHGTRLNLFSKRGILGRMMEWSMEDEAFKIQLFRFVDVLPSLRLSRDLTEALRLYLSEKSNNRSGVIDWGWRLGLNTAGLVPWAAAPIVRAAVLGMARQFIVGATPEEAAKRLHKLGKKGFDFTVDLLGEAVVNEREADEYAMRATALLDHLILATQSWPKRNSEFECSKNNQSIDQWPLINLSVKISAFSSQINPADPTTSLELLKQRLRPLLRRAAKARAFVNFDMESYSLKSLTLQLFKAIFSEPEFSQLPQAGIAIQAYLIDSKNDLEELISWATIQSRRITVRLVKGAYWDSEFIQAQQKGWPIPVFRRKFETDACYEELCDLMLENHAYVQSAFGTHNVRSIAAAVVIAEARGLKKTDYEFQMLYGMAEPIKQMLLRSGYRVREYCPVGDLIPGMAYLVRRLIENTSNEGFLRSNFFDGRSVNELLKDPKEKIAEAKIEDLVKTIEQSSKESDSKNFTNEPLLDFAIEANRQQVQQALISVRQKLEPFYPLLIDSRELKTERKMVSVNPASPKEVLGAIAKAGVGEAELAIQAARKAFPLWAEKSAEERAAVLDRIGKLLQKNRFELIALEILEVGKTWTEADGDVAEAIDFCFYYAREMRRLGGHHLTEKIAGESSYQHWIPRGVAVVIAPWNFPLAILCGMTTAALVTGNTVIMKPAEASSIIAAWFARLIMEAGVPHGVIHFLPGLGEEIGDYLVSHPEVDLIAFTGSMEVGLHINEIAGRTRLQQRNIKKVICEMGGKNAMIIDKDADLDEAVSGILTSAFGYQGQKCSALSRLIIVEDCYERLMARLLDAVAAASIGAPENPFTKIGTVVTAEARDHILSFIEKGKREATLAFQGTIPTEKIDPAGYYIPPTIFTHVQSDMKIAREEIFGPVLSVFKVKDFNEAISLANDSIFALTAGIYTRNPHHLKIAAEKLVAGNIYINRPITGAMVGRNPFGGFAMSGGGTKAGGPDYLTHFMFPRVVTENTVRRGLAANS